jgi:hypothetical protein
MERHPKSSVVQRSHSSIQRWFFTKTVVLAAMFFELLRDCERIEEKWGSGSRLKPQGAQPGVRTQKGAEQELPRFTPVTESKATRG